MNTKVLFSSENEEWETPIDFYNELNKEFKFNLDPCALPNNAKCEKFFTPNDNGLEQRWEGHQVFCNPPYGKEIGKWVKKCMESVGGTRVALLPARTDTRWFHDYVYGKAEIRFVKGRLKFGDSKNSAPFPSMVAIWRGEVK